MKNQKLIKKKNEDQSQKRQWLKILEVLYDGEFKDFLLQNLFDEQGELRIAALEIIEKKGLKEFKSHIYNLYLQTDSIEEKKRLVRVLRETGDFSLAKKFFPELSEITDIDLKAEVLNFLASYPEIRQLEDIVTNLAMQDDENRIKFSAIFNLATLGNYSILLRMIDQQRSVRESFICWLAIAANLQELSALKKSEDKPSFDLQKRTQFIKKIIRNRSGQYLNYPREVQFAYLNAYIESGEKGITSITKNIFQNFDTEDQLYLLELIELKLLQIGEKERILIQLLNVKIDAPSVRDRIIRMYRGIQENQILENKEISTLKDYIQKHFEKILHEYQVYYRDDSISDSNKNRVLNFLFRHGNESIQKKLVQYLNDYRGDRAMLQEIIKDFYKSSSQFSPEELKFFLQNIHNRTASLQKRIILDLSSVTFKKARLRNQLILILEVISELELNKLSDKIYKLFNLTLEIKDRDVLLASAYTLSKLKILSIYNDIQKVRHAGVDVSQKDILLILGKSKDIKAGDIIIDVLANRKILPENLNLAIDILSEISPVNYPPTVHILDNFFTRPQLQEPVIQAWGKVGNINNFHFLVNLLLEKKLPALEEKIIDAILSIAKRYQKNPELMTDNIYKLFNIVGNNSKIKLLFILVAVEDDYSTNIFQKISQDLDKQSLLSMLSHLYVLIQKHELSKSRFLIPFFELLIPLSIKFEIAGSLSRLLDLLTEEQKNELKKFISPEIEKLLPESSRNQQLDVKVDAIKKLSEKEKFIQEAEFQQDLAIFFSDIVGYTKKSSELSLLEIIELIKEYENICLPVIKSWQGRVVKKMGDGLMVSFPNSASAVNAAMEIQESLYQINLYRIGIRKIIIRIGIHSGPVFVKENDLFGDTVNLASRMESNAAPGSILITDKTYEEIKDEIYCLKLAPIKVKGKDEPILVYQPIQHGIGLNQDSLIVEDPISGPSQKVEQKEKTKESASRETANKPTDSWEEKWNALGNLDKLDALDRLTSIDKNWRSRQMELADEFLLAELKHHLEKAAKNSGSTLWKKKVRSILTILKDKNLD